MKTVPVKKLTSGMILARPVFDKNQEILLDAGIELTEEYIKRLKSRNIRMVSILDAEEDDDEIIEEEDEEIEEVDLLTDLKNKLSTIESLTYQEADEILKHTIHFNEDPEIQKILLEKIKIIDDSKILNTVLDILVSTSEIKIDHSDYYDIFSQQTDPDTKAIFLQLFLKSDSDESIIKPVIHALKDSTESIKQGVINILKNFDKKTVEKASFEILSENDKELNSQIVSLLNNLGFTESKKVKLKKEIEIPKQVNKQEKIKKVDSAKDTLGKVKVVSSRQIEDPSKVDEDDLKTKIDTRKEKTVEVKFEKIEYTETSRETYEKEYQENIDKTNNIFVGARSNQNIDTSSILSIANKIVSQVIANPKSAAELTDINTVDNYLISHSINTAYLSVLLGHLDKRPEKELVELAVGSLLHDVGMVKVKDLIWTSPERFSFDELFEIQKHTIYGIDTLVDVSKFKGNIAYMAYQHHERMDGSGYPKNKKGRQIPRHSRILGIADVFHAMTSTRSYRDPHSFNFAFNVMMKKDKEKFDQDYMRLLYDFYVENIDESLADLGPEPSVIMIIDDSPEIRVVASKLIKKQFGPLTDIIEAENGRQAINLLYRQGISPDIILLDVMMPEMDGFQFLEEMKFKKLKIPVLMLTGKRESASVKKAISFINVKDYIVKPFDKDLLINKITKYILRSS